MADSGNTVGGGLPKRALAGVPDVWARISALRIRDPGVLAPVFRARLQLALGDCSTRLPLTLDLPSGGRAIVPLDPILEETGRPDALQAIYFEQGTTRASTADHSWHWLVEPAGGFCLAVDVVSREFGWFTDRAAISRWPDREDREAVAAAWFRYVAVILKQYSLHWGGDWQHPDAPHFYPAELPATPSDEDRALERLGGRAAVWAHYKLDVTLPGV